MNWYLLRKIILYIFATAVFLPVAFFTFNLIAPDEDILPEAAELIRDAALGSSPEKNAFVLLSGIDAKPEVGMLELALQRPELNAIHRTDNKLGFEFRKEITILDFQPDFSSINDLIISKSELRKVLYTANCNPKWEKGCFLSHADGMDNKVLGNKLQQLMIERYLSIRDVDVFLPRGYPRLYLYVNNMYASASMIYLTSEYKTNDQTRFLNALLADTRAWNKHALSTKDLTMNMIGIGNISRNLHILSEYLDRHDIEDDNLDLVKSIIGEPNLSLGSCAVAKSEANYQAMFLYSQNSLNLPWYSIFFLEQNATFNGFFRYYLNMVDTFCSASSIDIHEERIYKTQSDISFLGKADYSPYNLIGKYLIYDTKRWLRSLPSDLDYARRIYDVQAQQRLMKIKLAVYTEPEKLASILSDSINYHPITNEPAYWDIQTGLLSFQCLSRTKEEECRFYLPRLLDL